MTKINSANHVISPGSTIGILGGGQLGRMTALAAANLGYSCHNFEPQADCPASQVSKNHTMAEYDDYQALSDFAAGCDVITLEFENVPVAAIKHIITNHDINVYPSAEVLNIAQNRVSEKLFLNQIGIKTAPWHMVNSLEDLKSGVTKLKLPAILKTTRGGYDGKGQIKITHDSDLPSIWNEIGKVEAILEGFIDFDKEISVIAARNHDGQIAAFDAVENLHKNHILDKTIVPANISPHMAVKAIEQAILAIEKFDVIGLLAVEMFICKNGDILVNEVAPRPHNSGHWTQDACVTSQFEQLVRAVCNLPLGSVERLGDAEMQNLLGTNIDIWPKIIAEQGAHLHLYGKCDVKDGRKMGHVNRLFKFKN